MFGKPTQEKLDRALLKAAAGFKLRKFEKLLDDGANLDAVTDEGNTVLHLLLTNAEIKGGDLHSPFHELIEFVSLLKTAEFDFNRPNKRGVTPLHSLCWQSNIEWAHTFALIVETIIKHGADPRATDLQGNTPLHILMGADITGARKKETMPHLCHADKINTPNNAGDTPLHILLKKPTKTDFIQAVDALLTLGGRADIRNSQRQLPFELATASAQYRVAIRLSKWQSSEDIQKIESAIPPPPATSPFDNWKLLSPEKVAEVTIENDLGYKLTSIFNFKSRTLTLMSQNMETKQEAVSIKDFDTLPQNGILDQAYEAYAHFGGKITREDARPLALVKDKPLPRPN